MFRRDTWRRGVQLDPHIFQERFYMLIDGRVEIMRSNPETGRNITLYISGQGDGIDIIALLTTTPHEIKPVARELLLARKSASRHTRCITQYQQMRNITWARNRKLKYNATIMNGSRTSLYGLLVIYRVVLRANFNTR